MSRRSVTASPVAATSGYSPQAHSPAVGIDPFNDLSVRLAAGEDAAFTELYTALQPRLHRYARSLVGQDADDVTAEARLQIARDLRTFTGDLDALRGWAVRIVRNRSWAWTRPPPARFWDAAPRQYGCRRTVG